VSGGLGHVHQYGKTSVVRDFCHFSVIENACSACGYLHQVTAKRDFDLNPLEIAFARRDCRVCRRMLEGREPASWAAA
jgi:hypothetical protein